MGALTGVLEAVPKYGSVEGVSPQDDTGVDSTWQTFAASSIGFLADSYDIFAIDIVLVALDLQYGQDMMSTWTRTTLTSAALIGMIIGQVSFGYLADVFGRKWVFVFTASLTVVGAVASSLVRDTAGTFDLPKQLAFCRFFLGMGIGGEYPLAATVSAEMVEDPSERGTCMALVISMQGWGMMLSACLAMLVVTWCASLDATWRLLLGLGAVPSSIAFFLRLRLHESDAFRQARRAGSGDSDRLRTTDVDGEAHKKNQIGIMLAGTATTWCLMNMSLYSLGSFKSSILNELLPVEGSSPEERLLHDAMCSMMVSLFAIVGFMCAIGLINRLGRFAMQLAGFMAIGVAFFALAYCSEKIDASNVGVFLFLLGIMFFFQNFGPNTTTFIVAAEAFPTRLRATCHGLSAASGKFGALCGVAALPSMKDNFGMPVVYMACGLTACLGAIITYGLTPRHPQSLKSLEDQL